MPFLIYTDKDNLIRAVKASKVRVPSHLNRLFDLGKVKPKDTIYLLDYGSGMIYGPLSAVSPSTREERNPRGGPFNGFGRVRGHYLYRSIEVDCSAMYRRGARLRGLEPDFRAPTFALSLEEERKIVRKLRIRNRKSVPLVLHVAREASLLRITFAELYGGMKVGHHVLRAGEGFYAFLGRKMRLIEGCFGSGRADQCLPALRSAGEAVYEQILKPCGLDRLFTEGGFTIDVAGDRSLCRIPFEVAWKGSFLFETNVLSYRGDGEGEGTTALPISKALILADPAEKFRGAYSEGLKLHRFLTGRGVAADLIARPLERGALADLLCGYDLVHFAGHSVPVIREDAGTPAGSSAVISSQRDGAEGGYPAGEERAWDIGVSHAPFGEDDVVPLGRFPRLVFSSACGNTLSLGFRFLEAGARNVIASRWTIPDRDLTGFVADFYGLLLDGVEIGSAFNESLLRAYLGGDVVPLSFVLLGESRRVYG
jgi:hypothetical protein